jgi:ABC-type methionine transport system permease subunit
MPTAAIDREASPLLRQLDLVALAVALPVFLIAGWPMLAYAVVAGVWLGIRGVELLLLRRTRNAIEDRNRLRVMGLTAASGLMRAWVIVLAVLLVGIADKDAGLAAALLALVVFSLHFATNLITNSARDAAAQREGQVR